MERRHCCSTISPLDVTLASPAGCDSPVRAVSSRWEQQVDVPLDFCSFLFFGPPERSRETSPTWGRVLLVGVQQTEQHRPRKDLQKSAALPALLSGGNASPELFPRMVKFGAAEEQTRRASNGERLNSGESTPRSSLR